MTSSVTNNSATAGSSAAQSSGSVLGASGSAADIQNSFLNLLVAQLKNQDPLNPMDNSQMTAQLAQISTVNGIQQLNSTVQQLLGSYGTSQEMQAASLVGHSVLSSGNTLDLAGGSATGGFNLDAAADHVTVTVTGPNGQIVHTATLNNLDAGVQTFQWDGTTDSGAASASGRYTFSVSAVSQGKSVAVSPLALSRVDGVNGGAAAGSAGTTFDTSTGTVPWSQVQQVM